MAAAVTLDVDPVGQDFDRLNWISGTFEGHNQIFAEPEGNHYRVFAAKDPFILASSPEHLPAKLPESFSCFCINGKALDVLSRDRDDTILTVPFEEPLDHFKKPQFGPVGSDLG